MQSQGDLLGQWSRWGRKKRLQFERDALLVRLLLDLGFAAAAIQCLREAGLFQGLPPS